MMIPAGEIKIMLEGATFEQVIHCKKIIDILFDQGIFNIKNGNAILSFDDLGNLASIKLEIMKWKKDKTSYPLANKYGNVKIEIKEQIKV